MPMLASTWSGRPSTWNGCSSAARIRSSACVEVGLRIGELAHEDAELVAAEPRDRVAAAQHRLEPAGELDEQQVAVAVAERVVDLLEAVEVHQQHRELRAVLVGDADRVLDLLPEASRGWAGP